jgi:hypothetical protein
LSFAGVAFAAPLLLDIAWKVAGSPHLSELFKRWRTACTSKKALKRLRQESDKNTAQHAGKPFHFGELSASVFVREFVAHGYDRHFITSSKIAFDASVPEQNRHSYTFHHQIYKKALAVGKIFEGRPALAVRRHAHAFSKLRLCCRLLVPSALKPSDWPTKLCYRNKATVPKQKSLQSHD